MPKPEEELEFINVVDHGAGSQSSGVGGRAIGSDSGNGGFGSSDGFGANLGFIRQSRHKTAALFHYVFKFFALFFYIMGGFKFVSSSAILTYIICILMLAFDFWTVKNVSGRLMVGLRWWSNVKEDGTTEWIFESLDDMSEINSADYKLFWIGLYGTPVLWFGLFITGVMLLKFQWLVIVVIALVLSGANIYGYTKCNADAKNKVQQVVNNGMMAGAMQGAQAAFGNESIRNALFSMLGTDGTQSGVPSNTSRADV